MKSVKDELQHIIQTDGAFGNGNLVKTIQNFLRGNEGADSQTKGVEYLKSEEEKRLVRFIQEKALLYKKEIKEEDFLDEGAEQRVYRLDSDFVIKLNDAIFYQSWLDYFNSLLIHNYYFSSTRYECLGFKNHNNKLYAVVKQAYIQSEEIVDIGGVKQFLEFNDFVNTRNNDYINKELGIIFEDLHDGNVISKGGILFFVDTIFYITDNFYK